MASWLGLPGIERMCKCSANTTATTCVQNKGRLYKGREKATDKSRERGLREKVKKKTRVY